MGWWAVIPVPSWICVRQEVPGAATKVIGDFRFLCRKGAINFVFEI